MTNCFCYRDGNQGSGRLNIAKASDTHIAVDRLINNFTSSKIIEHAFRWYPVYINYASQRLSSAPRIGEPDKRKSLATQIGEPNGKWQPPSA